MFELPGTGAGPLEALEIVLEPTVIIPADGERPVRRIALPGARLLPPENVEAGYTFTKTKRNPYPRRSDRYDRMARALSPLLRDRIIETLGLEKP